MVVNDFVVQVTKDMTEEQIATEVLDHLFHYPLRYNKPCVVVVTGGSGEGKSLSVHRIEELLYKKYGFTLEEMVMGVEHTTVVDPTTYPDKIGDMLNDKALKKYFVFKVDEARAVVGSDNWNSFANHSISHVNAVSRSVKPILFFIITQTLKDIDPATRRTLNFQIKVSRVGTKKPLLRIYRFYESDYNPEQIKLGKRKVIGVLVDEENNKYGISPTFKMNLPSKEIKDKYEAMVIKEKLEFLNTKLSQLADKMKNEKKATDFNRVDALAKHFIENPSELMSYGEFKRGKWKLKAMLKENLNLSKIQQNELERRLTEHNEQVNTGAV
jgi:hypothetical protein